eukprot:13231624-Alexandrium_andersonii.AAC.1
MPGLASRPGPQGPPRCSASRRRLAVRPPCLARGPAATSCHPMRLLWCEQSCSGSLPLPGQRVRRE